jgi:hypothetical protein
MASDKNISALESNITNKDNVCSECLEKSDKPNGGYSECCRGIVLPAVEMKRALKGKIPSIEFSGGSNGPRKSKVKDLKSGLRKGTMKFKVYKLWEKGLTYKEAAKRLGANESSARSWFGKFKKRSER